MRRPTRRDVLIAAVVLVAAGTIAYTVYRHWPRPLMIHCFPNPWNTIWDDSDPSLDDLARLDAELMARYDADRAYKPEDVRTETKTFFLGKVAVLEAYIPPGGFSECVLSGGPFDRPVRARFYEGKASVREYHSIRLEATICTPVVDGRPQKDEWWMSDYDVKSSGREYVVDGVVSLPNFGTTVEFKNRTCVEPTGNRHVDRWLPQMGVIVGGWSRWRPIRDPGRLTANELGTLFPELWEEYMADPDDLPSAASQDKSRIAEKVHRTVDLGEIETAETEARSDRDWESIYLDFTAACSVGGKLRPGEECELHLKEGKLIQVAAVTREADFWVTRVRGEDGQWRVEKEQFHDYTLHVGPEQHRIYGVVRVARDGKEVDITLGPDDYPPTQQDRPTPE
jgi:hypothetical protein